MSKQREALKMALEALNAVQDFGYNSRRQQIIYFISEVLAEPDQEPVVEFLGRRKTPEGTRECWGVLICDFMQDPAIGTKLYTAPPARKPLTDDEIMSLALQHNLDATWSKQLFEFARAIERAHGIE